MGNFQTKAITEKIKIDRDYSFLKFGSCEMQGWRKNMVNKK